MSDKYDHLVKEIPMHGRRGNIRQGAVLERDFFEWDTFSLRYGLVDGCGMIPEETDKLHTHDYDQILWFISADADDMLHLGAELEVDLGAEGVRFKIATPHHIIIPRGMPHFSPVVTGLERPFLFLSINLTGDLKAAVADENAVQGAGAFNQFRGPFTENVKPMSFSPNNPYNYGSARSQPSGGIHVFLDGNAIGLPVTMGWSTVKQPHILGPWRDDGLYHPHTHEEFDEALLFLGLDMDDLSELHGTADCCVGAEGEEQKHYLLTKSTVCAMKKGTPHLPLVYPTVERPSVFVTLGNH